MKVNDTQKFSNLFLSSSSNILKLILKFSEAQIFVYFVANHALDLVEFAIQPTKKKKLERITEQINEYFKNKFHEQLLQL